MNTAKAKSKGVALVVVLVLLTVISTLGISTLKDSVLELQLAKSHLAFERIDQASDTAIDCVMTNVMNNGLNAATRFLGSALSSTIPAGATTEGCSAQVTDKRIREHRFDEVPAISVNQYCGKAAPDFLDASDVEWFQAYRYLTTGRSEQGKPIPTRSTHQQAWEIVLPNNAAQLDIIQTMEINGKNQEVSSQQVCESNVALF